MKKRWIALALGALLLAGCAGGKTSETPAEATAAPAPTEAAEEQAPPTPQALIEDMVVYYGQYGDEAREKEADLLLQLRALDPDKADRWERIMELWSTLDESAEIHPEILPDGLCDTDELCLVVLGFQLEPDGTMREELVERLNVALACAEKYPQALIACTGGGTAAENDSVTEAGKMAEYLMEQGVAPERIIVEDRSQTTAQNAVFTLEILRDKHPATRQLAIISSDYHIATGVLLFSAQAILSAEDPGEETFRVVSNAAWPAPSGSLSSMFQAGALIELSGNVDKAYDIYYETYDIHELPPPEKRS